MSNRNQPIQFIIFVFFMIPWIMISCEKDRYSEEEAMDSLQHTDLFIQIQNGSTFSETLEDAKVSLSHEGESSEKTTDSTGCVVFKNLNIGEKVTVQVSKKNYTRAVFEVSTSPGSYQVSQITKTLKIYPLTGENLATVKGQLTLETDLTNRKREYVANKQIKVVNHNLSKNQVGTFTGKTDSLGNYQVKVPVNPQGSDNLEVLFPVVDTTQTLAMELGNRYQIVHQGTTYFPDQYKASEIPCTPSAYASIEHPPDSAKGFRLGAKGVPVPLSNDMLEIIASG